MSSQLNLDYTPLHKEPKDTSVDAFAKIKRLTLSNQVIFHLKIRGFYGATNCSQNWPLNLLKKNQKL